MYFKRHGSNIFYVMQSKKYAYNKNAISGIVIKSLSKTNDNETQTKEQKNLNTQQF